MIITLRTRYVGPIKANVVVETYAVGGRKAIELVAAEDQDGIMKGEGLLTATVNILGATEQGEVLLKDYSENEGLLECLVAEGVVEDTGRRVQSGFVQLPVCKMLVPPCARDNLGNQARHTQAEIEGPA